MQSRPSRARQTTPAGLVRPGLVFSCVVLLWAAPSFATDHKGEVGLGVHFGGGKYDNEDFNADLVRVGYDPIDNGVEYGFSIDYRLSRWLSISGSATRIGGQSTSPVPPTDTTFAPIYTVRGSPLVFGVIGHPVGSKHLNLDVFAGIGPLLNAQIQQSVGIYELEAKRTGIYWHGGVTGEYRFSPMVGVTLSWLARHAEAKNVDLRAITGDPEAHWDLTFNGTAVWFGPKLYFGTTE